MIQILINSQIDLKVEIVNQLLENDFAYEDDGAVSFTVEKDKEIFFQDYIREDMKFNTNDVEDFVILGR